MNSPLTLKFAKAVVYSHIVYSNMGDPYCVHCKADNYEESDSDEVSHKPDCVVLKAQQFIKDHKE